MKYSIYNNRIPLSEKSDILYNALSDKFIAIAHNFTLPSPESLSEGHRQLFGDNGMIVDDCADEYSLLQETWRNEALSEDFFLIVNPTLKCNFSCWYCYENHDGCTNMTKETLGRVIAAINRIIDTYPKVAIGFFGGEPLLKYDSIVKPIMEHGTGYANAIGKDISFSFTTNGYLLPEERIKFLRQHNIQSFQITLDGGRKFHDETRNTHNKGSYDTILSNAKSLLGNDLPVTLRFNVTKENINSFTDVVEWISHLPTDNKRNLTVTVHQVWQTIKKEELTDDIDRLIDSIIAQGVYACGVKQDNLRNMCYGDKKNTAIINYNGDIYRCTAVDFKNVPGIGHISPDGCLSEEESHIDRLINSRWEKHICRECRIMPLCLGGCSKKIIDNPPEYCVYDDDEAKKDKVVLDIIKNRVRVMEYNKIIDTFVNV